MGKQGLSLYISSAGSGKTFTLVAAYLKILIAHPHNYRKILAITFTNKATEEMKTRVLDTLFELSQEKENAYYTLLKTHFIEIGKPEISIFRNAKIALDFILMDYNNFSISTIESFCQRILRAFAREMNITLGYDIEMKTSTVVRRIIDELLDEAGKNESLTQQLQELVAYSFEKDKGWDLRREISITGKEITTEKYQEALAFSHTHMPISEEENGEILLELKKYTDKEIKHFEASLRAKAKAYFDYIQEKELGEAFWANIQKDAKNAIERVKETHNLFSLLSGSVPKNITTGIAEAVAQAKSETKGFLTKAKKDFRNAYQGIVEELQSLAFDFYSYLYENRTHYFNAVTVQKTLGSYRLMQHLNRKLTEYRKEHQTMLISDTNGFLRKILENEDDSPFIYEKLGNRFQYFLLDEFQDTSNLQWLNLLPLLLNAIAISEDECLLIVGDAKQSIYRWRGGEMRLLLHDVEMAIRTRFRTQRQALFHPHHLNTNWRTACKIVAFNNLFFEASAKRIQQELESAKFSPEHIHFLQSAYDNVAQVPQKNNIEGYVSLSFFKKEGVKNSWKEEAKARTYEILLELQADGFPMKEVVLLTRTNQESQDIVSYLQNKGIKITSSESLLLSSSPAVKMLLGIMQYLTNPKDLIAAASIRYYFNIVQNQQIDPLHSNYDSIFRQKELEGFMLSLETHKTDLLQSPLYESVEKLLRIIPQLYIPDAYVQGFLDIIIEYTLRNEDGLSGFLEWWETEAKNTKYVVCPPQADSVQLLTIHKAKGLEFPVVIVPFGDFSITPKFNSQSILWVHPQTSPYNRAEVYPIMNAAVLAKTDFQADFEREYFQSILDNLNVLYVCFTRPKYRLYVNSCYVAKKEDAKKTEEKTPAASFDIDNYKIKNIHDFLYPIVMETKLLEGEAKEKDTEQHTYTLGAAIPYEEILAIEKKVYHEENTTHFQEDYRPLQEWKQKIKVQTWQNPLYYGDRLTLAEKIDKGVLLHNCLQKINRPEDISFAVEKMILQGLIKPEMQEPLISELQQIVLHPKAAAWFSDKYIARNEAEILWNNGTSILRPDKVLIDKMTHEAILIDYKTGVIKEEHEFQLRLYLGALQDMGYKNPKGYLYYFRNKEIIEIQP